MLLELYTFQTYHFSVRFGSVLPKRRFNSVRVRFDCRLLPVWCMSVYVGGRCLVSVTHWPTATHVLNAAARTVTASGKSDPAGLAQLLHAELHWVDVSERVLYKLTLTVHQCLQYKAQQYLLNYCVLISEVASRQHLRFAAWHRPISFYTGSAMSPHYIRLSGLPCCWPDVLELTGRWTANLLEWHSV